jgi:hypothetical protein
VQHPTGSKLVGCGAPIPLHLTRRGLREHFEKFVIYGFMRQRSKLRAAGKTQDVDRPVQQRTVTISDEITKCCRLNHRPYGGRYSDVVPHLSVANQCTDEQELERIAVEFAQASQGELPIGARATEITLMDTTSGRWEIRTKLRLG